MQAPMEESPRQLRAVEGVLLLHPVRYSGGCMSHPRPACITVLTIETPVIAHRVLNHCQDVPACHLPLPSHHT
jgi:hypothetical protein